MQSDRVAYFRDEQWTAGVIGLGYVGLPLAMAISAAGLDVIGFDVDPIKVSRLADGSSDSIDVASDQIKAALLTGFRPTTSARDLRAADMLIVCVPSPLGPNREPDLSFIRNAAETVAENARGGTLVALESTTYPGTTRDILLPAAESTGLELDRDVFVAYSPERVSPGDGLKIADIPKVVGGVSPASTDVAAAAYGRFITDIHPVGSSEVAEMSKLLENTYRAVNIGLVNEISVLAHELGIDIWETIDAASTKPFGYHRFLPGPGVGGHCIPLDPQYLAWRARAARLPLTFIEATERVNNSMPRYIAQRAGALLNEQGLHTAGARILGVGITYKPDVADDRESASIDVLNILRNDGADVVVVDPTLDQRGIEAHGFGFADSLTLNGDDYDMAIVLTDHTEVDYALVASRSSIVLDTRNAYRFRDRLAPNVVPL